MAEEIIRERYYHDNGCPQNIYTPTNARGLHTCLDCAGIFDAKTGEGAFVTDKRFDENWTPPEEKNV